MSSPEALHPGTLRAVPALGALLAHLPGLLLAAVWLASGVSPPVWVLALLIGLVAASLTVYWGLPVWWRAINLLFVPLLWLTTQFEISPGWFLAGFAVLAATSLGVVVTRVPLYLSSHRAAEELARQLPAQGRMLDLGCGFGGPLASVGRLRPDARLAGIEAAPFNWLLARLRLRGRAEIRLGSLWQAKLDDADVVYAYLSPAAMPRLWEKARAEMKPGSLLVSNSFTVPGVPPMQIIELNDLSRARLLLWKMP